MNPFSVSIRQMAVLAALVMVVWASACTKGPQGEVGPAGEQGPAGTQGPAGSANVIYSPWTNMNNTNFWSGTANVLTAYIGANKVSTDFLAKGTLLVFCKQADQVRLLPYDINSIFGNLTYRAYATGDGRVYLEQIWYSTRPSTFTSLAVNEFRYVLIPGGVPARQAAIDFSDYAAVKKAYNLPD